MKYTHTYIYIYDYTYTGYNVSIYTWTYTTFVHLKKVANSWPASLGPTTITFVYIKISLSLSLSIYMYRYVGMLSFFVRIRFWTRRLMFSWDPCSYTLSPQGARGGREWRRRGWRRELLGQGVLLADDCLCCPCMTRVECMSALNMDLVVVALPTQTK